MRQRTRRQHGGLFVGGALGFRWTLGYCSDARHIFFCIVFFIKGPRPLRTPERRAVCLGSERRREWRREPSEGGREGWLEGGGGICGPAPWSFTSRYDGLDAAAGFDSHQASRTSDQKEERKCCQRTPADSEEEGLGGG